MFNQKRKRNQFMLALPLFVVGLVLVGFLLTLGVTNSKITAVEVASASFDYTHDRDQYWYPAVVPFDYTRDRDQYWQPAVETQFDYTRDRDQYSYPAIAPFDYTRDRDQYWQSAAAPFDYTRDRDQYWQPAAPSWEVARQQYELSVKGLVPGWAAAQQ